MKHVANIGAMRNASHMFFEIFEDEGTSWRQLHVTRLELFVELFLRNKNGLCVCILVFRNCGLIAVMGFYGIVDTF